MTKKENKLFEGEESNFITSLLSHSCFTIDLVFDKVKSLNPSLILGIYPEIILWRFYSYLCSESFETI